jgi:hypothetical protein
MREASQGSWEGAGETLHLTNSNALLEQARPAKLNIPPGALNLNVQIRLMNMPGDNTTETEYLEGLFEEINKLRKEVKSYWRDGSSILESQQRESQNKINSRLKKLPHGLFLWGFLEDGKQAEFWTTSENEKLYSRNNEGAGVLSKKYGLTLINGMPWDEIRFKKEGIDADILSIKPYGQLIVYLDFPQAVDLMRDVLEID